MNRPLALVCFICGRQFGTKSLAIHIKSCQQKWENQENLKPPKLRRPCPQPPNGFNQLIAKQNITKKDIIAFNQGSFSTFVQQSLVECQYCGRKFNEKSLVPHQKACKTNPMIRKHYVSKEQKKFQQSNKPLKSTGSYQNAQYEVEKSNQNLIPCRKCGRTFNPDRVAKHEKVCKQTKQPVTKIQMSKKDVSTINSKPNMFKKKQNIGQKVPKWKAQHQELQNAMKAMRQMKKFQQNGGNLRDLPPPPPSNYDHYVQCKYCGRKYAPDVAQRHIPKCATIINKPGGIKPSKIQQKYVGSTGVKKIETPVIKSYNSKSNYPQNQRVVPKSPLLKPNLKPSTINSMIKKR